MKKVFGLVLALAICMSVSCTAFAEAFTASVENKSAPAVVEIVNEAGETAIATLTGDLPEGMEMVSVDALVVTSVADAESSDQIPEASQQALLEVYNGLQDGSIQVPFEELDAEKASDLVIRDLFDVSWVDVIGDDFKNVLESEGISLEMTFAMDIAADATVYVMVYKNDVWQEIQQVTNNGDGTITCVFAHLCPVAVIVEAEEVEVAEVENEADQAVASVQSAEEGEVEESAGQNIALWVGILVAASVALVAIFAGMKKKQK